MKSYKIAVIGGDGIGPEVIASGLSVLRAAGESFLELNVTPLDWGSERYLRSGSYMPENGLHILRQHDAIYFGAVGSQAVPDHISLRELRIKICAGLQLEVCTRPAWILPGVQSPLLNAAAVNWLFIRQNVDGEYAGRGSRFTADNGLAAEDVAVYNHASIERIAVYAFEAAKSRRRQVAYGTKSNAMPHGMVLWDETIEAVAKYYPDVKCERVLTDALAYRMIMQPGSLDVILASNLHNDILTDVAAAVMGSLGLAPSGNIDPARRNPPMFEPTHGSGYTLIGTGYANPIGAILSGALMLEYLGEPESASRVRRAVEAATAKGIVTPDIGGSSTTDQVTSFIAEQLRSA